MKTTFLLDTKFFSSLKLLGTEREMVETNCKRVTFLVKIKGYGLTFGRNRTGRLAAAKRKSLRDAEPVGVSRSLFDKLHVFFPRFFLLLRYSCNGLCPVLSDFCPYRHFSIKASQGSLRASFLPVLAP